MLVQRVRRVPPATASSCQRISLPPHVYSSVRGASARRTVVSVICGWGEPTVVSLTVFPAFPRLASASKGAHSRSCAGSVIACHTFSGEWRSSRTRISVHLSPSFRTCAPLAGPSSYCSRAVTFFSLSSSWFVLIELCGRDGVRAHPHERTRTAGTERARHPFLETVPASGGRDGAVRPPWIPRNRRRAARADALTRWAAASQVDVRFLQPTVPTTPAGSRSRGGSAPR